MMHRLRSWLAVTLLVSMIVACNDAQHSSKAGGQDANDDVADATDAGDATQDAIDDGGDTSDPDDTGSDPDQPDYGEFAHPDEAYDGRVEVSLHPPAAADGDEYEVVFAVPFPRGWLDDPDTISLHRDQEELAIASERLQNWPALDGDGDPSVRSVRISLRIALTDDQPETLELRWGGPREAELEEPIAPTDTWIPIDESQVHPDEYTTTEIYEPQVYATLPATWFAVGEVRSPTRPLDDWSESQWFDTALLGYSHTMVNDVPDAVQQDDLVKYEPDRWDDPGSADTGSWLFDRASTLWGVYLRTGEVKWLRHAHRATQFYARNIERDNDDNPDDSANRNIRGQFRLKDVNYADHKYSYGLPLLIDRLVVGAETNGPADAEDAVRAVSDIIQDNYWEENFGPVGAYDPDKGSNFTWTERHHAYAFAAHLTAWEYTEEETYRDKLEAYIEQMLDHIDQPPGGYTSADCLIHDFKHHEWDRFSSDAVGICSPWMTALLAEPLWRYYRLTEDDRALELLAAFATSVAEHGTYIAQDVADISESSDLWDARLPEYLYSTSFSAADPDSYPSDDPKDGQVISGPQQDWEHTCDVAGLVQRGVVAGQLLDRTMDTEQTVADQLIASCSTVLDKWHRPGDDDYLSQNGPEWRLTPSRKYNWWFGTTHDLPWLAESSH
ncbi:MAG: hypothetical protein ACOCV2_02885 [Persicimonas sp.]